MAEKTEKTEEAGDFNPPKPRTGSPKVQKAPKPRTGSPKVNFSRSPSFRLSSRIGWRLRHIGSWYSHACACSSNLISSLLWTPASSRWHLRIPCKAGSSRPEFSNGYFKPFQWTSCQHYQHLQSLTPLWKTRFRFSLRQQELLGNGVDLRDLHVFACGLRKEVQIESNNNRRTWIVKYVLQRLKTTTSTISKRAIWITVQSPQNISYTSKSRKNMYQ